MFNIKENEYNLIQTLSYHTDGVNKIIELKNGRLVSCSYDKSIIIYSKENNEYIKDFDFKTNGPNGPVIQTKENEICYYEGTDNTICFYDLNERKIITSINNVNDACHYYDCLIMISKDLLLMTGDSRLTIINCNSHNIIRNINAPGSGNIWAACLLNNDILLAADDNHRITQWKIENDNLKFISKLEEAHDRAVRALKKIGKGLIISADGKGVVKVW